MLPIHRRQDLHDFVAEVMSHTYDRLLRGERFDVGQAMLKSYLVEAHPSSPDRRPADRDDRLQFLRAGLEHLDGVVSDTDDARLFTFDAPGGDDDPLSFVVDMEDERYWTLHTASPTSSADRLVERLVGDGPFLDSAWLPGRFLTGFTRLGRLYKVSVRFSDEQLQAPVPAGRHQFGIRLGADQQIGYFSASADTAELDHFDGESGQSVALTLRDQAHLRAGLQELDSTEYLSHSINVTRAEVKYYWNGVEDEFSNARIYGWGKVTGSGSSAGAHLELLRRLRREYRNRIETVEERFGLRARDGRLSGQPLNETYRPVANFETFVFNLFSGTRPFRLAGVPQFRRRDYAVVSALDLHSRQPLRFEVTPEYMTVALRAGTCGNSIARLYTNLLEHLDARTVIYGGDADARLFE